VIDTLKAPVIGSPKAMISSTEKGLLIMIDPDVSVFGTKTSFLHWLIPDVDLSTETAIVPATGGNVVSYFQPSPPPSDPPHRYTFLLYAQPSNFTIPSKYSNLKLSVFGFDVNAFATAAGLGEPKAATFMRVQG
jgi:phosphatidylethanolamine-binding protein